MSGDSAQHWTFPDDVPKAIRQFLGSGAWRRDAVRVGREQQQAVFRCTPPGQEHAIIVKEGMAPVPLGWLRRRHPSPAAAEFMVLRSVLDAGLAVPQPLGWTHTCGGDLLATTEVRGRPLEEWLRPANTSSRDGLAALSDFMRQVWRQGLDCPGLNPATIVVEERPGMPAFSLTDLTGARLYPDPGVECKRRLLARFVPLFEELPSGLRAELLGRIVAGDPYAEFLTWPTLVRTWGKLCAIRWPYWRNCILGTDHTCQGLGDAPDIWQVTGDPAGHETACRALAAYRSGEHPDVTLLKDDRKRRVARVRTEGTSQIVKEYRNVAWRWYWRPDRLGWLNTSRARLLSRRIAACPAWVRGQSGEGYLVQEDVGEACLHDFVRLSRPSPAERRAWLTRMADALAFLHLSGCFHADLKVANWVAGPDGRLRIVDCDDVRFFRTLPEWARERNLRQIAETCPPGVTRREKLRFLVLYGRAAELPDARLRELTQGL